MNRIVLLFMAVLMLLTFSTTAFAVEVAQQTKVPKSQKILSKAYNGYALEVPDIRNSVDTKEWPSDEPASQDPSMEDYNV